MFVIKIQNAYRKLYLIEIDWKDEIKSDKVG